jgi:hypothetical protein
VDDDVSLFIGCLPGEERRQIVLFPGGEVLAEIYEKEIETPVGSYVADRGSGAAAALIRALNGSGWYIDHVDHAAAVWLKPSRDAQAPIRLDIRGIGLTRRGDEPDSAERFSA